MGGRNEQVNSNSLAIVMTTAHWHSGIIRPHPSTTNVDEAYCYNRSSVVCRSVCLFLCHDHDPCKNG